MHHQRHFIPTPQCTACVLYATSSLFEATELLSFLRVFVDGVSGLAQDDSIGEAVCTEALHNAQARAAEQLDMGEREGERKGHVTEWGGIYDACRSADLRGCASARRVAVRGALDVLAVETVPKGLGRLLGGVAYSVSTVSPIVAPLGQGGGAGGTHAQYGLTHMTLPAPTRGSLPHAAAGRVLPVAPLDFLLVTSTAAFTSHSTVLECATEAGMDSDSDSDELSW